VAVKHNRENNRDVKRTVEISVYKKEVIKKIENFIKSHKEIIFAYIFGSFIEQETFNDVDVAIYVNENNIPAKEVFPLSYLS
jgi:predicted nucleotidyltransferase